MGGGLKKQKKFYLMIRHGARAALVWHHPRTIIEWVTHPAYAEKIESQMNVAFR